MKTLWRKDVPIINSMLEIDVYKFTMLYFIYTFFPEMEVEFAFINRNFRVRLADRVDVDELRDQCRHIMNLRFTENDKDFFRKWGLFPEDFIHWLSTVRLPEPVIRKTKNGQFDIRVSGKWTAVTFWELYILPVLSELNSRYCVKSSGLSHEEIIRGGEERLLEKIEIFRNLRWRIALFGLRRRASGDWERHVTKILNSEIPHIISGTSNVKIAREFEMEAIGTMAHELFMGLYALRRWESYERAFESQFEVLEKWQELYGYKLKIMLSDTFGSPQFYENLPRKYLRDWRGSRQDSGDPFAYGEMVIDLYKKNGIDPWQKLIFFTDGLNPQKMVQLEKRFFRQVGGGFGVGTNISNDLPVIEPISMVMKLVKAAGNPAVKLSDNLNKAIGDEKELLVAKKIFGYTNTFKEECVY